MPEIEDSQAQRRKCELKAYKNTPQNAHLVEAAEEDGFEVYERNRKYVRLRRPLTSAPDGPAPADAEGESTDGAAGAQGADDEEAPSEDTSSTE